MFLLLSVESFNYVFKGVKKVLGVKKYRSIEEVYYALYVENKDSFEERKELEDTINKYLERGFTQYDAMVNLVVSDERVKRDDNGNYLCVSR